MSIESMMYFALGALASALVMLMILPAVWRRAVRLTKKRIEAATPVTLAEFRADKDQLRADFALSTRRLEMNVEALRQRLSEQLGDVSRKRSDLASMSSEHEAHLTAVHELEDREQVLRERVLDLERDSAELVRRLAAREDELAARTEELAGARETILAGLPPSFLKPGGGLSGDYNEDVDELLTALAVERKRAGYFELQVNDLLDRLEQLGTHSSAANSTAALAEPAGRGDIKSGANENLVEAEVRIANAESRLNALLEQTTRIVANGQQREGQLLAEKLSVDAQVEQLREQVLGVEHTVTADWDGGGLEPAQLRERLGDIAANVSRVVYAVDNHAGPAATEPEESLFERVQRFASDGQSTDALAAGNAGASVSRSGSGSVLDRMAALRELRGRS